MTPDYERGFTHGQAGHPLVSNIDASYSGHYITGWLDGRESASAKPIRNEYTVSLTATFPFATLPVGGSFSVPRAIATNARGAATMWKRAHAGWDYRTRNVQGGIEIERVA